MTPGEIAQYRLDGQRIAHSELYDPAEVVASMGAMQAQDHAGALWSIGLRLGRANQSDVEQAITDRKIVRTWPMRGTLHFVATQDVRWMLRLLTPRVIAGSAARQHALELDSATFGRSAEIMTEAMQGGKILTRDAIYQALEQGGVSTAGSRGYHLLWRNAQEGLICFGPHDAKQPTFVLLDEWIPESRLLEREEALAELAHRYFSSHGPATLHDFAWWSGLKMADAREGIEGAASQLARRKVGDKTYWMPPVQSGMATDSPSAYLLPGFDEYLLGYTDCSDVLEPAHSAKIIPGSNGVFMPTLVIDGRVRGIWKRVLRKTSMTMTPIPFTPLTVAEERALATATEHYSRFLGLRLA
jgi:hypothetical protein